MNPTCQVQTQGVSRFEDVSQPTSALDLQRALLDSLTLLPEASNRSYRLVNKADCLALQEERRFGHEDPVD